MRSSLAIFALMYASIVQFGFAQPGGDGGGEGGDGGGGGEDGGGGGGGGPQFSPASDQCLTPEQYNESIPSSFEGYGSCFQYTRNEDGTATVYITNVPDHIVHVSNPNVLCYMTRKITLPNPVKTDTNTRIPQTGAIAIATNGVYIFGGLEGNSGNAVSGPEEDQLRVACDGHAQPSGIWHYHHPDFGCIVHDENTLVGYAYDGFPIYGALTGTKDEVDAILDDCNGRDFEDGNFGYRYHVRSRSQVDETLEDNDGENNTDNWKYVLGCYRGAEFYQGNEGEVVDSCVALTETTATTVSPLTTGISSGDSTDSTTITTDGTTVAAADNSPECFPADATVELESGENRRMDALQLGDSVLVGEKQYSPVFMFTHRHAEVEAAYVHLSTASGAALRLTPGHYLYLNQALSPAAEARIGDVVELANGESSAIVGVSLSSGRGLFNPQTVHGDIVVDGVRSSTYTTAVSPSLAHAMLFTARGLYAVTGWSSKAAESMSWLARVFPGGSIAM